MAKSGDVIGNPVTGELVTFEGTAGETGGELLSLRIEHATRIPGPEAPASEADRAARGDLRSLAIEVAVQRALSRRDGPPARYPPQRIEASSRETSPAEASGR